MRGALLALGLALAAPAAAAAAGVDLATWPAERVPADDPDRAALLAAAEAELARALEMRLPDQPPPYVAFVEVLDGDVATASAAHGALVSMDHGPYRNLRVEVRVGSYELDNGNFEADFGGPGGVGIRLLAQDPVALSHRHEMWLALDGAYKGAAEQFSSKLAARRGRPGPHPPDLARIDAPLVTEPLRAPPAAADRVREIVVALSAAAGDSPVVERAEAIARDWQGVRLVASTEGTRAWLPTGFAVVRVEASARATDGARVEDMRWWVARTADRLPSLDEMRAEIADMVAWLERLVDAPVEEDYLGPVLFEEPAAVEFFRQLVLAEISGTPPVERPADPDSDEDAAPTPVARIGRRLLPEGWTIVDDPAGWPGEAGAYLWDFEAVRAERVEVVRDGVVRDLLMSRVPRRDLARSNGHGRSLGSERRIGMPAVVRVEPPRSRSVRALRRKALALAREAGLDYVLVVRRLVPPAMSGDFQIAFTGEGPLAGLTRPVEAYRLYADGREEPVRNLRFVGVDRRVLRDVVAAGAVSAPVGVLDAAPGTARFSIGAVGGLPATWMAPPVVVAEMELRGRPRREPRAVPPPPPER